MWTRDPILPRHSSRLPSRAAPASSRRPDDDNHLLESVHRRGLEEQALELQSLLRRTKIQLAESQDQLRRFQLKVTGLEDAQEAAMAKIVTLESVKGYSMELQSRLAFAEQQAEERKLELNATRGDVVALRRQIDEGLRREDEAGHRFNDIDHALHQAREALRTAQDEKLGALESLHQSEESATQLQHELRHKDVVISKIEHEKNDLRRDVASLEQQLYATREDADTIAALRQRVAVLEEQDRRMALSKAEVELLQSDNARMIKLLKATNEYAEFEVFANDSKGVSYVPQTSEGAAGGASPGSGTLRDEPGSGVNWADADVMAARYPPHPEPLDTATEIENWVPTEAMRAAKEFRTVQVPHLPMDTIHVFIRNMNRIWRAREAQHVDRLRMAFKEQLDEYVRRFNQHKSYEAVMAEWSIRRLKKEVKQGRKKNLKGRASKRMGDHSAQSTGGSPGRQAASMSHMDHISQQQLLEASLTTAGRPPAHISGHQRADPSNPSGWLSGEQEGDE